LSITLSDTIIPVSDKFCIDGTLLAKCDSLVLPDTLFVKFSTPKKLFKIVSVSEQYSVISNDSLMILTIKFPSNKLQLNIDYSFNICLTSYLSDTLISEFQAIDDTSNYNLIYNDPSLIKLTMCAENIRQVYFFVITSFEYKIFSDKISIYLNTEEKGIFRFYLNDLLGNLIKKVDFNATLDKYKNDNVQEIDITNIANGTYFLRMKTPNGKFTNNNVVLLK